MKGQGQRPRTAPQTPPQTEGVPLAVKGEGTGTAAPDSPGGASRNHERKTYPLARRNGTTRSALPPILHLEKGVIHTAPYHSPPQGVALRGAGNGQHLPRPDGQLVQRWHDTPA